MKTSFYTVPRILFQSWGVENPFKIMFSSYFGLKFTMCHIPVIIMIPNYNRNMTYRKFKAKIRGKRFFNGFSTSHL